MPEDLVAFRDNIQVKLHNILEEFAEGKLNREQFHAIYERYNQQLNLANQAIEAGGRNKTPDEMSETGQTTIAIREQYMGKAMGLVIYANRQGVTLETLGDFEVKPDVIAPTLNDITQLLERGAYVDRRVEKLGEKRWLLYVAGKYTTVVTLFRNEPSQQQIREIERLHADFETANAAFLGKPGAVDVSKLAYPFLVFVQKKLRS